MRLKEQSKGATIAHLRIWALACVIVGVAGVCILLRGILGVDTHGNTLQDAEYMMALFTNERTRGYVVTALICMAVETCAVPLFCMMLVEGALNTGDFTRYMIRVFAVALVSEVPYDFATRGVWLDLSTLNPVFGMGIALVMLYFFLRYPGNHAGALVLRSILTVVAILWTMLPGVPSVEHGPCIVLVTAVLWTFRAKPLWRAVLCGVAGLACCIFSPYYVAAPLGAVVLYFYRGEKGADFKWGRLVAYPAILLLCGLVYGLLT